METGFSTVYGPVTSWRHAHACTICGRGVIFFGIKFGHAASLGSAATFFNVPNPFLKLTQFLRV